MITMSPVDRGRNKEMLDLGWKEMAVDWSVKHAGRIDPVKAQRGKARLWQRPMFIARMTCGSAPLIELTISGSAPARRPRSSRLCGLYGAERGGFRAR